MRVAAPILWLLAAGCTCPAGQASCGGQCVELGTSADHCGGCGRRCSGLCRSGFCQVDGCRTDADCDDGRACNGLEGCVSATCQQIEPPVNCDDGIFCTVDGCVEPGTCTNAPSDDRCPVGGTCDGAAPSGCEVSCSFEPCDVLTGCGCLRDEGCYETGGAFHCELAGDGRGASGDACARNSDCESGAGCREHSFVPSVESDRRCGRYCRSEADCPANGSCLGDGVSVTGICFTNCDPTDDRCPGDLGCTLAQTSAGDFAICRYVPGTSTAGERCVGHGDCAAGHICVTGTDVAFCRRLCVTDSDCRSSSRDCVGLTDPIVVDGTTYGACI